MATTIKEFRSKYPEYNDISDDDLTKKLHQKHYSDMDYNEFSGKFNPSREFDNAYERNVPETIRAGIGGLESMARGAWNVPAGALAQAAGTFKDLLSGKGVDSAIQTGQQYAQKVQIDPFTHYGKVADEAMGEGIERGTRVLAEGAGNLAATSPGVKLGLSTPDEARNVAESVTEGITHAGLVAPMITPMARVPGRLRERRALREKEAAAKAAKEAEQTQLTEKQREILDNVLEYKPVEEPVSASIDVPGKMPRGPKVRSEPEYWPSNRRVEYEGPQRTLDFEGNLLEADGLARPIPPAIERTIQGREALERPIDPRQLELPFREPIVEPSIARRTIPEQMELPLQRESALAREGRETDLAWQQREPSVISKDEAFQRMESMTFEEKTQMLREQDNALRRQIEQEDPIEPTQGGPRIQQPTSRVRLPGRQRGTINPEVFQDGFQKAKDLAEKGIQLLARKAPSRYGERFLEIEAKDKNGTTLGRAAFTPTNDGLNLFSSTTEVGKGFRGRGIATDIYKFANELGNDIVPSKYQTAQGKAMWEGFNRNWMVEDGKFKPMPGPSKQRGWIPKDQVSEGIANLVNKARARADKKAEREFNRVGKTNKDIIDAAQSNTRTIEEWKADGNEFSPLPDWESLKTMVGTSLSKAMALASSPSNLARQTKNKGLYYVMEQVNNFSSNAWLKNSLMKKGLRTDVKSGFTVKEIADPNSVQHQLSRRWSKSELQQLADIANEYGGKGIPDKQALMARGVKQKVIDMAFRIENEIFKPMWDDFNASRKAAGKKEVTYLPFYWAKNFGEGNFTVRIKDAKNPTGDSLFFHRAESMDKAKAIGEEFKAKLGEGEYLIESRFEPQRKSTERFNLGPGVFEDIISALDTKDPRRKMLRNMMNEIRGKQTAGGHTEHRRNVAGGDLTAKNLWKTIDDYTNNITNSIVNNEITAFQKALRADEGYKKAGKEFQGYVEGFLERKRGGGVMELTRKLEDAVDGFLSVIPGLRKLPGINRVLSTTNKWFLNTMLMTLNPKFYVATTLQSTVMGGTGLATYANAMGYKGSSWGAVGKGWMDMVSPTKDQKKFISWLTERNEIDPVFIHDLGKLSGEASGVALRFIDKTFHYAGAGVAKAGERMNRTHAALSAYNLLYDNGLRGKRLYQEASRAMHEVMGDYRATDKATILDVTGPVGTALSPLATFANFYGGLLINGLTEFSKGAATANINRMAPLFNAILGFTAVSGLLGAPMINAASSIWDLFKTSPVGRHLGFNENSLSLEEHILGNLPDPAVFGLLDWATTAIDDRGMRIAGSATAPEVNLLGSDPARMAPGLSYAYKFADGISTYVSEMLSELNIEGIGRKHSQQELDKAFQQAVPTMLAKLNNMLDTLNEDKVWREGPLPKGQRGFGGEVRDDAWSRGAALLGSGTLEEARNVQGKRAYQERQQEFSTKQSRIVDVYVDEILKDNPDFDKLDQLVEKASELGIDNFNSLVNSAVKNRSRSEDERKVGKGLTRRQRDFLERQLEREAAR